ncbi:hypothetical protein BX600DRAFT_443284 [Xylariales sp. PMI_506]|nr:hypothetical protein BX600DRAFT_443284 [Xylariales sp. PMI_506]
MSRAIDKLPAPPPDHHIRLIVTSKSRVGTMSMYDALKMLGYRPYHMYEVVINGVTHMNVLNEALQAKYMGVGKPYGKPEFDKWFANYDSVVEVAWFFLEEMVEYYPDAQFLHTERDLDAWHRSMDKTVAQVFQDVRKFPFKQLRLIDAFVDAMCRVQFTFERVFCGGKTWDESEEFCKREFVEFNHKVRDLVPSGQLAVFKLEDGFGWEQICPYLGQPIPDIPYPIGNMPAQFHKEVGKIMGPVLLKGAVTFFALESGISGSGTPCAGQDDRLSLAKKGVCLVFHSTSSARSQIVREDLRAMHLAWQIADIRHLILEHLEPKDLARLARTCTSLFNVTVGVLWKILTDFSPFICCLPTDYYLRTLTREDVNRLDWYSSKVGYINLEGGAGRRLNRPDHLLWRAKRKTKWAKTWLELWVEIAKLRPASGFLPNLRSLRLVNVGAAFLIPLVGTHGLNLVQLHMENVMPVSDRKGGDVVSRFFSGIDKAKNLEYISAANGVARYVPASLIQQQESLRYLRLRPQKRRDIKANPVPDEQKLYDAIFCKSGLQHLTMGLTKGWRTPVNETREPKSFAALQDLGLDLTALAIDYGPTSPIGFLEALDNPELHALSIKFPVEVTGPVFLDVVNAANRSCRLQNLVKLSLSGGGWLQAHGKDPRGHEVPRPPPLISGEELRQSITMLLPFHRLKLLRLSVAPNFLDILDLALYRSIAEGLPALEQLWLGHREFNGYLHNQWGPSYESLPLHHLAAFCHLLPCLFHVGVGGVDWTVLVEPPRPEFACPGVRFLTIFNGVSRSNFRLSRSDLVAISMRTYFPESDLVKYPPPRDSQQWYTSYTRS